MAWAVCAAAPSSADNQAFWAAASAPSTLYTPLHAEGEERPPTAWCDGQGQPSCAPAAPAAPHQTVSFSHAPVAVLTDLRLRIAQDAVEPPAAERVEDAREGVRRRVERPPRA